MNSQALTKPFHNSAHGSSRPARSSSASSEFISSQHPYRTVLASSWVLRLCSPIHTLLPLAGLFHPSFLPPRGQRQLLSSMSSCKALQAELLGSTSTAGFSHNCFSPFRERKGKSRWKPHVSCVKWISLQIREHGERKLNLLLQLPQKDYGFCMA